MCVCANTIFKLAVHFCLVLVRFINVFVSFILAFILRTRLVFVYVVSVLVIADITEHVQCRPKQSLEFAQFTLTLV